MATSPAALHRTIVVVDIAGFTDEARTMADQAAVHDGLYAVLTRGFTEAGVDLASCVVEDRGDGAMILVPPEIPKSELVSRLPAALATALRRYNAVHTAAAGIQLRVVVHAGEVRLNPNGVVSQAVNLAFRILDADEARSALRRSGTALVLVASDPFYRDVVQHDPAAEPDSYRPITVSVKNTRATAWLRSVVGASPPHLARPGKHVPEIWGDVPARNPIFTGRDELLGSLSHRLSAGDPTVVLSAALHGMGGVGKTQMAVEYIYRHLDRYDLVWWIPATQAAQIRAGLTRLAQRIRLPGADEGKTAVPAVLDALRLGQPYRRWLLVFDAADSPNVVRPFLPANGPGEVLITSRNPGWFDIAQPVEVSVFDRSESVELLRRRGLEVTDDEAEQLAEKLGDLPLAVEQAATWQVETGMPVREYLRLFDEKVAEILGASAPADYEVALGAAWNLSFDELQTRNPTAYQILQVCAFFAPEPIARSIFTGFQGASTSPGLAAALRDPMPLSRAIRDINRYGLAKVDHRGGTLLLHRLVQLLLRNRMTPGEREETRHLGHLLLANQDPNAPASASLWPRYQALLPHVSASELVRCDHPAVRQLLLNLSLYLYYWGDHDEAAVLAGRALDAWSAKNGETDRHALEAAGLLGLYFWALSRYAEAVERGERTLELRRGVSGEDAKETIVAELSVAVGMKAQGRFLAARDSNERIYRKAIAGYGPDDPITLQTAHDLAVAERLCGDYRRAFELDAHTHQRRAELLGHDDMDTLNTLSGLLLDRRELGDHRGARVEHERILERVRQILGDDKAGTLVRSRHLAVARRKDGDHAAALELSTRTLRRYRRWYGDEHPDTLACAVANSIDLRNAGDLAAARRLGQLAFDRYLGKLGERHPHTLSAAADLAVTLCVCGDTALARTLAERSAESFRAILGPDHPHTLVCTINLAGDLAVLGEIEAAAALSARSWHRCREVLGVDHPTTLAAGMNLTLDLRTAGRVSEAAAQHADIVTRCLRVLGDEHPITIAARAGVRVSCDIDPLPT